MAVKEVKLSTIEEALTTPTTAEFNDALKRNRSAFLFRGLPNVSYKLTTSLRWNCKGKAGELEPSILRNFSKYAASTSPLNSCWEQMVIGQHHGLPTRLMDWTYSPLAALHFATSREDITGMNQHDAVVWAIDITEMNTLLPAKYQKVLNDERAYLFTIDMLDRVQKTSLHTTMTWARMASFFWSRLLSTNGLLTNILISLLFRLELRILSNSWMKKRRERSSIFWIRRFGGRSVICSTSAMSTRGLFIPVWMGWLRG